MEQKATPFTQLRLLPDNHTAWLAKRHLVATAQHTLDLAYFILEEDATTSRLMLDLIGAAQRGVRVRLLVDYFTTFRQARTLRLLGGVPGLRVRRYGVPDPAWLAALQAAGIDSGGFVRGLVTTDAAMLAASLKGSALFPGAVAAQVQALPTDRGGSAVQFQGQVLGTLQAAATATASPAAGDASYEADVRRLAVTIKVLQGLKQFLHRSHHKLLLADGRRFVMGGRNLADLYHAERPAEGHAFHDTDLLAHDGSPGGSAHAQAFQALWSSAHAADIRTPDPLDDRPALPMGELQQRAATLPDQAPGAPFRAGVRLPDMHGTLVDNLPGERGDPAITQAYVMAIERLLARGRPATVDIVSAYLFLNDDPGASATLMALRDVLLRAVAAGVTVNIHTNSLASTDLKPVNRAAYPRLMALMEAGVRIHELAGRHRSLHTKAAAIGDDCLIVGSYNMDPRSELYDTNNLIVLHDDSGAATAAFRRTRIRALRWKLLGLDEVRQWAQAAPPGPLSRITDSVL